MRLCTGEDGFVTLPAGFGVRLGATVRRRWRALVAVAAGAALLALPVTAALMWLLPPSGGRPAAVRFGAGLWIALVSVGAAAVVLSSGIGRVLVHAAEAIAHQWGCLAVEVTSRRSRQDAHAFYQRLGYTDSCQQSARFMKTLP
jgi:GNAT superfamily N-acetyltransferase